MKEKRWLMPAVTLVVAFLVVFASARLLAPVAQENRNAQLQWMMSQLLPGAESFVQEEYTGEDAVISAVYKAENGYVIETVSNGYAGEIVMLVGVNNDGSISGLVVREMKETYGLGKRALNDADFLSQMLWNGTTMTVGENVDALSGATVTSKAIAKAVNSASAFVTGADIDSSATEWGG